MTTPIISAESLGKRYLISHRDDSGDGLRHTLENMVRRPLQWMKRRKRLRHAAAEEFWALKDVSFDIHPGDVVGIVGHNGAGKSTLLKLLSRITEPSAGRIRLRGRIASLLEVGTGFHQDLTGRENIYLNGAILGMRRAEIRRKFDEIVAFAEVEKFLDTPVKRYSSGMYVRLAFAVAAHLEPEILVVDEVLAVGDAQFQKKCLGKMQNVAQGGRTVLFVSHNMGAVTTLCRTAMWLNAGRLLRSGSAREIVDAYATSNRESLRNDIDLGREPRAGHFGEAARIESLQWLSGLPLQHGESVSARVHLRILQDVDDLTVGIGFSTPEGVRLLTYETDFQDGFRPSLRKGSECNVDVSIPELPLAPGLYSIDVGSRSGDTFGVDYLPGVALIEVAIGRHTPGNIVRQGAGVRLRSEWTWSYSESQERVAQ